MLIRLVPYLYEYVRTTEYFSVAVLRRVERDYVCTVEIPTRWEPHRVHLGHPRIELERELELGCIKSLGCD